MENEKNITTETDNIVGTEGTTHSDPTNQLKLIVPL